MPRQPSESSTPAWVRIVACCAAIACLIALTYGTILAPNAAVSNTAIVFVGSAVLVAFGGIFGPGVVAGVVGRFRGDTSDAKRR